MDAQKNTVALTFEAYLRLLLGTGGRPGSAPGAASVPDPQPPRILPDLPKDQPLS